MTLVIIGFCVAPFILMVGWLEWDRRLDRIDHRELDEQQARDAVRVQRTVHAEPMLHRRNGGGWVA